MSFGVKKKYQSSFTLMGTPQPPSVRILRTLALNKQNELAVGLWQKAAAESRKLRESNEAEGGGAERRSVYTAQLVLEEKILWVKVALVEKVLLDFVNLLISQWRLVVGCVCWGSRAACTRVDWGAHTLACTHVHISVCGSGVRGMLTSCAGSSVLAAVDPTVQLEALKFVK